jgi:membrane-associated phospholipid phosphatase
MWRSDIWQRFVYLWWLKGLLSTAFIYAFFMLYFYLLRHPAYLVMTVPTTWVDEWVTFSPRWLWIYLSLWVYVCLPVALLRNFLEVRQFLIGMVALLTVGLVAFYIWPTRIGVSVAADGSSDAYTLLKKLDTSGNSCPSLHVATAVFAAIWLRDLCQRIGAPKWLNMFSLLWCAAIVYSTMAIKQHVLLDVLGGLILAVACAWPWRLARLKP